MTLTVLAPQREQTKPRRAMLGNCRSSAKSSASKVNAVACMHAAFAHVTNRPSSSCL